MALDNREIAFLTWLSLIAGTVVWKTRKRDTLRSLLSMFVKPPILNLLGTVGCYVTACVWLLSFPGWWQWSNLKTTLLWTGSFALIATFNFEKSALGNDLPPLSRTTRS